MRSKLFTKNSFGIAFLVLWALTVTIVISLQMAGHLVALPVPNNVERLVREASAGSDGKWTHVHVIYQQCSCTNSLLKHLVKRGARQDAREIVLVIGDHAEHEDDLSRAGFFVEKKNRDSFVEQYGIEAAPVMIAADPSGAVRYLGGYFRTSEAKRSLDEQILNEVHGGRAAESLPVYGCAMSPRLRKYFDPFGFKWN